MPGWNESSVDQSWRGEPNAPKNESWDDQSLESNVPKTQGATRTNQSTTYTEEYPYNNVTNEDNLYNTQDWSYSNQPPSYDQVHPPESLWQPYCMEGYENELETVDELQYLEEFGMKPP